MKASIPFIVVAFAGAAALAFLPAAGANRDRGGTDPGKLPQTHQLPSLATPRFHARMTALWKGILSDSPAAAMPAFFPRSAYLQVKQISNAAADYDNRLLVSYRADIRAAHELVAHGGPRARLVSVRVPRQWAWIPAGYCFNKVGYWHAPGSRLAYVQAGLVRSFGIFSLISWRGEWYVIHLAVYNQPGTVDDPSSGLGSFGPPGGC